MSIHGHTYADQPVPTAELHDDGTITFAVTFRWNKEWASETCEIAHLTGRLRDAVLDHFKDADTVQALESVLCWYPAEEILLGNYQDPPWTDRPINRPYNLRTGELEYTERDIELQKAWRDLLTAVRHSTYKANDRDEMIALGTKIAEALAVIHPAHPENSTEWTALDRSMTLGSAIDRANVSDIWTASTLNAAFEKAVSNRRKAGKGKS